jgi:hypothetical protein
MNTSVILCMIATFGATWPAAALADELHLMCDGTHSVLAATVGSGVVRNNDTGETATVETHQADWQPVRAQVYIDITGETGRIQFPESMVSRGKNADGWLPMSRLEVSDRMIRAEVKTHVAFLPIKLLLRVDRFAGHADVSGWETFQFTGDCRAYDPSPMGRKF